MPNGDPLAVSIFRIAGLDDDDVWEIARETIVDRPVYGRGDPAAGVVYGIGLTFDVDDVSEGDPRDRLVPAGVGDAAPLAVGAGASGMGETRGRRGGQ